MHSGRKRPVKNFCDRWPMPMSMRLTRDVAKYHKLMADQKVPRYFPASEDQSYLYREKRFLAFPIQAFCF
jgi:hypothetical protein